ncbi:hypothetical protein BKA69DRAFT_1065189 [Paraphysoderma sedebokerense]|nr:hypothetical protein BKA69DRAFT_1065057 [Paraphysoderma sedebokerense]KAI9142881.1 hypothetical protein BKA69DRAFT_1065189 [Paraphysoderma sedebokerense]
MRILNWYIHAVPLLLGPLHIVNANSFCPEADSRKPKLSDRFGLNSTLLPNPVYSELPSKLSSHLPYILSTLLHSPSPEFIEQHNTPLADLPSKTYYDLLNSTVFNKDGTICRARDQSTAWIATDDIKTQLDQMIQSIEEVKKNDNVVVGFLSPKFLINPHTSTNTILVFDTHFENVGDLHVLDYLHKDGKHCGEMADFQKALVLTAGYKSFNQLKGLEIRGNAGQLQHGFYKAKFNQRDFILALAPALTDSNITCTMQTSNMYTSCVYQEDNCRPTAVSTQKKPLQIIAVGYVEENIGRLEKWKMNGLAREIGRIYQEQLKASLMPSVHPSSGKAADSLPPWFTSLNSTSIEGKGKCIEIHIVEDEGAKQQAEKPPFLVLLLLQLCGTVGDILAQISGRKYYKSSKRVLVATTIFSSAAVLVLGGLLQIIFPVLTGLIFKNEYPVQCYHEVDILGYHPSYCSSSLASTCQPIECPSQGPLSMLWLLWLHPVLLWNGFLGILYHIAEAVVYLHPLGILLKPVGTIISTLFVPVIGAILGFHEKPVNMYWYLFGAVGSFFCLLDETMIKKVESWGSDIRNFRFRRYTKLAMTTRKDSGATLAGIDELVKDCDDFELQDLIVIPGLEVNLDEDCDKSSKSPPTDNSNSFRTQSSPVSLKNTIRITVAFFVLSICYAIWSAIQKYSNNQLHVNEFGYTAIDQVLAPFYVFPFLMITEYMKEGSISSVITDAKLSFSPLPCVILILTSRVFAVGRSVVFFWLAINYNLASVLFATTLFRLAMSVCWVGFVHLKKPSWMEAENLVFDKKVFAIKGIGVVLILLVVAL